MGHTLIKDAGARGFRFASAPEIPAIARLVNHCFPAPGRNRAWWTDYLATPVFGGGPETLLVGEESGTFVAACQVHPFHQWIAGSAMPVTGVSTVAISPAYRKRGLGAELVTAALRHGRERGDVGAALYPFRISFYQRLGFGLAGVVLQHLVQTTSLRRSDERQRVELLDDEAGRAQALALFNRWIRDETGQMERTSRMWARIFEAPDHILAGYRNASGELEGYAFAIYRIDLPPEKRYLEVEELVWTTDESRRGMYGWLGSLDDQWQQLLVRTVPSHRFSDWLRDPVMPHGSAPPWRLWTPSATQMTGLMFRLLDVKAAFEGRRVNAGPALAASFIVSDAEIDANNANWRVALDAGRATVERSGPADVTLRLDVSTLSRIFIGALPPSAALRSELIECDRPELLPVLDAALALPDPWTFERF